MEGYVMRGIGAAAASAVIMLGGAGGAAAADLDTKAPVLKAAPAPGTCTSILDFFTTACQLAAYGVRLYGTIDVGYGYQSNGAPLDKQTPTGLTYFPQKMNNGGKWQISPNALSVSNVGITVSEPLGAGWSFVAQLETGFNPAGLALDNGPGSLRDGLGVPLGLEKGISDSSYNGQFYNSLGYFGVSNDTWGTLTFFRQGTLMRDVTASYDPIPSYAFSLVAATGPISGGGDTQNVRATTAVKYRVSFGNYRIGAFVQVGDYDEGNSSKGAFQGQLGADFNVGPGVFSVDAVGGYTRDAVSEALSGFQVNPLTGLGLANSPATGITATISDNTNVLAGAKYTVDKLQLFGGYEWMQFANPSDPATSFTDPAGYVIGGVPGTAINNAAYNKDKILQVAWTGARYSITPSLDVATAYYRYWQNDYSLGAATSGSGGKTTCAVIATAVSSCAGSQDAVSAVLDWKFAPKWDTYIGTMYTRLNGGLDSGFLAKDNWATTAGVRFRW
jgi:predicted porin